MKRLKKAKKCCIIYKNLTKKVIIMLEKVNDTKDLKKLTIKEKEELAKDIS